VPAVRGRDQLAGRQDRNAIIAAIIGKPNFDDLTFTIHKSVFRHGAFIKS